MKKTFTLLVLAMAISSAIAQTVKIGTTSYNSITEAIDAAQDGDVIYITGVHTESINIGKSITLRGADPSIDIIQAAATPASDGTGARVIGAGEGDFDITIENLSIRNGNAPDTDNGGGINADKITGLLRLKNLIIENNYTAKNGGGVSLAGSNVDIVECAILNNNSALDGGGFIAVPNNGAAINCTVNIKRSLIDGNTGRNGGGLYINGNQGYGNDYTIDVNVENSIVSNNEASSASSGAGGGAVWCKVAQWTTNAGGDGTSGNINLSFVHATIYNNTHAALVKGGLRFTGTTGYTTNLSAFNSIIVSADDLSVKAINFANANLTNMVNCIIGGLEAAATANTVIDDAAKNNAKGKTSTFAGLATSLTDEGGNVNVLTIGNGNNNAVDYCTAATGIALPTTDARNFSRDVTPDAGAFELNGVATNVGQVPVLDVTISPNPATDFFNVIGTSQVRTVNIYSLGGVLVKSVSNTNHVDVSTFTNGVYLVQLVGENGEAIKKLVVK
ncbi:T9SS type A sorting domain-containing protein [Carboxylicivirga marina]|uniref:T9SS type A sorting domain-containing protein n=1 Tax=Carboxylicivirga marina TaxID=2800988 RepID=A0ABS1HEV2_9BACT|nr:T9SS type A sorting domain-containing protein [Carboxylicivirga marina]MBK3516204.1 T9SS type A sorting domain-containing protein [Carboxylicivirga marina]